MAAVRQITVEDARRETLSWLGRDYLADICDDEDLDVSDRRSISAHVDAIEKAGIPLGEILHPLTRDELKAICAAWGLDEKGREKDLLIERIAHLLEPKQPSVARVTGSLSGTKPDVTPSPERMAKGKRQSNKQHRSTLFVSYAHVDSHWLDLLRIHLKPLEKQGLIELWDDTQIQAGMKWREEIKKAIEKARVAVLMVSPHFLASDFITNNELPPLLESAEQDGLIVVPVITGPCRFTKTPVLSRYQAINDPNKTLQDMSDADRNRVFVKLADRIETYLAK